MTDNTIETEASPIGEFIAAPASTTVGQIIDEAPATHGANDAVRVLLQADPHRPAKSSWLHLEPGDDRFV